MLLQCQMLMLNDAKALHNEVHAFGSEPCRLFQLALHDVFYSVFLTLFSSDVNACWTFLYGHTSTCTQRCACPLPHSAQTLLHSALCFMDYCQHFVQYGSNKVFFQVNEGQLTLLNFPKEAMKRQKLRVFLFL